MSEIKNPEREVKPAANYSEKDLVDSGDELDNFGTFGGKWERKANLDKKYNELCKEAFDNSVAKLEKDKNGNDYKELLPLEKVALSDKLKDNINSVPKGSRGDHRVPEPEKIRGISVKVDGHIKIDEAWKKGSDGAKEGTRHMEIITAKDVKDRPTYIDRIGSNEGAYFCPMKEDGTPYSLKERATGDYLPEKRLEDNDSYHKYEIKQDFTRENFEAAIDKTYTDEKINKQMKNILSAYYKDASRSFATDGHNGESYKFDGDSIDGIKSGEIDNMFGTKDNPDGGGKQYITPFNAHELEKMGMIEEVDKGER